MYAGNAVYVWYANSFKETSPKTSIKSFYLQFFINFPMQVLIRFFNNNFQLIFAAILSIAVALFFRRPWGEEI